MIERNRQQADPVAEPNSFRHLAERAVPDFWRRRVRPFAQKMMLDGPYRMVAKPVREFHLLGCLMIDVVLEARVMRPAPLKFVLQRKFHRRVPPLRVSRVRPIGGLRGDNAPWGLPRANLGKHLLSDNFY